jgi:hypothetical protein
MLNYFQSVESEIFTSVYCLMCPKELTVFLRPTEAEDRGSRKSVGVKKRGTQRLWILADEP